jgi:hypothetical protein
MKNNSLILVTVLACIAATTESAEIIFSDDFSAAGNLNGAAADIGGSWSVTSGNLSIAGGAVDTAASNSGSADLAFASFSRNLGADETLVLTFNTIESSGNFATTGWTGISLYENGNEQVFMGSPGFPTAEWGIAGAAIGSTQTFAPSITTEPQTAEFDYVYNTGAWTFTVNDQTLGGTTSANLAFDQIRIGADSSNIADLAVSDINVTTTIPEPATIALTALFGGGIFFVRRIFII